MSSGVDTLNTLAERLKETINEIQERYESFIDSNQLYRQGKINERDFFASIGDYLVASSAMNFITVQTIFEMKSFVEGKAPAGDRPEQIISSPSPVFSSKGGIVNSKYTTESKTVGGEQYNLTKPQQPSFEPVENGSRSRSIDSGQNRPKNTKDCIVCGKAIPMQAKFCTRCGKSQ
jgi:hypothetical protein